MERGWGCKEVGRGRGGRKAAFGKHYGSLPHTVKSMSIV